MREVCQHCGVEARPEANFCHGCGRTLERQCPTCNTPYAPGTHFCANCGANLTQANEDTDTAHFDPVTDTGSPVPGILTCPRCNESNETSATYCYSCGLPLDDVDIRPGTIFVSVPAFSNARPGGFWARVVALIIDRIVQIILFVIILQVFFDQSLVQYADSPDLDGSHLVEFLLIVSYFTISIGLWSTTIGKRIFGLYVVRTDGSKVSPARALARSLAYFLSVFSLGIGFLIVAFRQDKRGLHDLLCDTVVIHR
ncbi:MAG: RDD family protein [Dehalococcoidia bacterium]